MSEQNETNEVKEILLCGQSNSVDRKAFILNDEPRLKVFKIPNGFDTLKYVLTDKIPSLIIMDLLSERINGLHFCYLTKKLLDIKNLKVIIFSEHTHRNNIIKGIQSGAADYIIDPCSDLLFKDRVLYHLFETPITAKQIDENNSGEQPIWRFLTFKKDGNKELFYFEKRSSTGIAEIKKISRDLNIKDFSSLSMEEPTHEEFQFAKNAALGDTSRFKLSLKTPENEQKSFGNIKVVTEPGPDPKFGVKKLDLYEKIEPKEQLPGTLETDEHAPRRDVVINVKDLTSLALQNRNLKVLLEVENDINTTLDRHDRIFNVIERISNFIDISRASIIVPSDDGTTGLVLVSHDDRSLENLRIDLDAYPEIGKCLETGEIIFIEDVTCSDILKKVMSKIKHLDSSSIIVIPIRKDNKTIAVLSIRGKKGTKFISYEDISYCHLIASAASKTIAGNIFLQKIMSKFVPKTF